jgi:hypothetical protein
MQNQSKLILIIVGAITKKVPCDKADTGLNGWKPLLPNPDKPEIIATKAPRHKQLIFIIIKLRVLVSWWRKYFVR